MTPTMRPPLPSRLPVVAAVLLAAGCVAHPPLAEGIPVRRLPAEVLGHSKCDLQPVPLSLLRQDIPAAYRVDSGDVLTVFAEDVLGARDRIPIQNNPDPNAARPAAQGYPITVQDDGTIQIPEVPPIGVRGMTLNEVRAAIVKAITVDKKLIVPGKERVTVDLLKVRQSRVLVIREDGPAEASCGDGTKGTGHSLKLDAYHNDLLEALTRTGGLPGPCAKNDVIIRHDDPARSVVRIPVRICPGEAIGFSPADIILKDGDTVLVEARGHEAYTIVGGPGCGQYPLPRDSDVRVLDALSKAICPAPACGMVTVLRPIGAHRQVPILVNLGEALRDPRENILILPGDTIVLPGCKDCGPKAKQPFRPRIWLGPGKWKTDGCEPCAQIV
ncbi:MAG TPA: polysaccharide biosynthesis/export family protein, partial [Urbifossiella sp.]